MKEKSKGGGLPNFNREHWEQKPGETQVGGGRYCSEMGAAQELKSQVDKLAAYTKKNKMQY